MVEPDPPRAAVAARVVRLALSTRGLFVVAGIAVAVILIVLWAGTRAGHAASVTTVTGAPTTRSDGASAAAGASAPSAPGGGSTTGSTAASARPTVVVHVLGAVGQPGLYSLRSGDRVAAALEKAGGASDTADLSRLNLARVLIDGERVYVPAVGESTIPQELAPAGGGTGSGGDAASGGTDAIVDLNTAALADIETLPGIGPALAARIIAWRTEHGRFNSVDDLLEVSGIGDSKFADLQGRVCV